jgi:hypothetical protein
MSREDYETVSKVRLFPSILALVMILVACRAAIGQEVPPPPSPPAPPEAIEAAKEFLVPIDNAAYDQSWESGSPLLKGSIKSAQWQALLTINRHRFGTLISRTIESSESLTSVTGVPDGQYGVITYRSAFTLRKPALEIVTVARDDDGKWRGFRYEVKFTPRASKAAH